MTVSSEVLCIGNAHIDVFLTIPKSNSSCHINKESDEICMPLDKKILVDASGFLLGGGACNVAVGLSRLGLKTSLAAEIGDDELSESIITKLTAEGVDTTRIIKTKNSPASFSVGIRFYDARPLFVGHVHRKHELEFNTVSAAWVYLGGLGREWHGAYKKTIELVTRQGKKLAFAPGTTQIEAGREEIEDVLRISEILFLNKQEAIRISNDEFLISKESANDQMLQLLSSLKKLGPKIVVITDGEHGSHVIDEEGTVHMGKGSEKLAKEKTGAGDAFAAGFLAAFAKGLDIKKAIDWGTKNAGSVIQDIGAQTGLLTKEKISNL